MKKLQRYVRVRRVTSWRDGTAVYEAASDEFAWVDDRVLRENRPHDTNVIYSRPPVTYSGAWFRTVEEENEK